MKLKIDLNTMKMSDDGRILKMSEVCGYDKKKGTIKQREYSLVFNDSLANKKNNAKLKVFIAKLSRFYMEISKQGDSPIIEIYCENIYNLIKTLLQQLRLAEGTVEMPFISDNVSYVLKRHVCNYPMIKQRGNKPV